MLQEKLQKVEKIIIDNNKISYKNVCFEDSGVYYHKSKDGIEEVSEKPKLIELIKDIGNEGPSIGDEYAYEVKPGTTYNFNILSIEGTGENKKINLMMNKSICIDGTVDYTSDNNYCRYGWHVGAYDNNYGPDTAMKTLYEATKYWVNVPDMIMNYTDEKNTNSETIGYISIITNPSTKVTTITGKQEKTSDNQTFGNESLPLKARLPKENEIFSAGCSGSVGSCPAWMINNMSYYNVANDKYSINSSNVQGTPMYYISFFGYYHQIQLFLQLLV